MLALYANGFAADPQPTPSVVNNGNVDTYTWSGLLAYDTQGIEIDYSVVEEDEDVPAGYKRSVAEDGTVTNTLLTEISGTKIWNDGGNENRPTGNVLTLYANGFAADPQPTPSVVNNGNVDTYTWSGLLAYDTQGTKIDYSVVEEDEDVPAGYVRSIVEGQIVNTLVRTFVVTKAWDDADNDNRPASITVQLYAGTVPYGNPVQLSGGDTPAWTYTWEDLPVYDGREEIVYSVVETATPAGYRTYIDSGEILNTLNTPIVELSKTVDKTRVLGGEQFAYTITLTNSMLREVSVAAVYDSLAASQNFVDFTDHGTGAAIYNSFTRIITWEGSIPAATYVEGAFVPGTASFTFTVTADELTALEEGYRLLLNSATGEFEDPYWPEFPENGQEEPPTYPLTSNTVEVEVLGPVMSISKQTSKTEAHPGETMTYTLTAQSRSLLPFDVTISDLLPDGVTFEEFITTGYGENQDAANLKLLTWNFKMPAATFNPETMEVTAPAEVTLSFVVSVDAISVDEDVVTIENSAVLTPKKDEETPYDPIPSNEVETDVTVEVTVHKAASVVDMFVGDPTRDRRWIYIFTLTNTNTAPMQVNLVDEFDSHISFYNWVENISTDPSVFPHIVSQAAYEDPDTGIHSINSTLVLAPATVDSQGNVIPSEVQYLVIVEGNYIELEGDASVEIPVPNIGRYAVSTNITDPINPQTAERQNTNTATVIVWAINSVLPVTGEWIMLMVPFGGLMTLAGVLLLIMNRRRQHAK